MLESNVLSAKEEKQELNSTHHWTIVLKGSVCLKHVFGSVLVCGQHFTQIKTSRVRICRYIEGETLWSATHMNGHFNSLSLTKTDLNFPAVRRFPQSRLKFP